MCRVDSARSRCSFIASFCLNSSSRAGDHLWAALWLRESLRGAGLALIDFVSAFDSLLHVAIEATLHHFRYAARRPLS
jgi:hypothetical protein